MSATVVLAHAADFADPVTILSLAAIALGILFIFLYNALTMRRTQLDRQLDHLRVILRRRAELASALAPDVSPVAATTPVADLLRMDMAAAEAVAASPNPDPEKREEYRKLELLLAEVLEPCRSALEHYNRIVEQPEARRIMQFFRFKPREKF